MNPELLGVPLTIEKQRIVGGQCILDSHLRKLSSLYLIKIMLRRALVDTTCVACSQFSQGHVMLSLAVPTIIDLDHHHEGVFPPSFKV